MKAVHRLIAAAAFLTLGACASPPPSTNDNLIVPGERVGNVRIGMSLAELFNVKGAPGKTIPIPNTEATSYNYDGLTVGADDRVYWIIAHDPRYRTGYGVATGSEQIFARGTYGEPKCVVTRGDETVYDYGNIYFEVDNASGKVKQVGIQQRTQTCDGV